MMNRRLCKLHLVKLCISIIIATSLSMPVYAQEGDFALLIQSSPPDGGVVSPGMGIQKVAVGQTLALSATPKKGYRFLYWLGDVESNTGPDTTVTVATPKLVIAVFVREDFEDELPGLGIIDGRYGGGGGRFNNPVQSPASVNPSPMPIDFDPPVPPTLLPPFRPLNPPATDVDDDIQDIDDDIPIPGDGDDIPVPGDNEIPEPATLLLLGLGSSVLLKKQRKR